MHKNKIIAFQGVAGANADLACRQAYPYYDSLPCATFEEAVKKVENKEADLCMVPIENSKSGRVAEIHNLMLNTDLFIIAEHFLKVEHCLVAPQNASLKDIKQIYSHPQALMQCSDNLAKLLPGAEKIKHSNTAVAAKDIASWGDKTKAAICSSLAAELYNLKILKKNIEDKSDNRTVFIAMSREPFDPDPKLGKVITGVIFTARNIPASLYKALGGFATNHVNMLKIESYIPAGQSGSAQFFISFEGYPNDENVRLALEELGFFCRKVRVIGVYYADKSRYE